MGGYNINDAQLWGFLKNNTQYQYGVQDGKEICFVQPLQFTYENQIQVSNKIGNVRIGNTDCEVYKSQSFFQYTNEEVIIDPTNCALMFSRIENNIGAIGKGAFLYTNFVVNPDTSNIRLPQVCLENAITLESQQTSLLTNHLVNHIKSLHS